MNPTIKSYITIVVFFLIALCNGCSKPKEIKNEQNIQHENILNQSEQTRNQPIGNDKLSNINEENNIEESIRLIFQDGKKIKKEYSNGSYFTLEKQDNTAIQKVYFPNGRIQYLRQYNESGKLNGVAEMYNENGLLLLEANFKDGIEDGLVRSYYNNGILKNEVIPFRLINIPQ